MTLRLQCWLFAIGAALFAAGTAPGFATAFGAGATNVVCFAGSWFFTSAALIQLRLSVDGMDRLAALHTAIALVRRGGTISLSGVYGGAADPINMMVLFDKQIRLRMGQANVKRWIPDIMPLLTDADPLGVDTFATHRLPLEDAPQAYESFQKKADGMVKVVLRP